MASAKVRIILTLAGFFAALVVILISLHPFNNRKIRGYDVQSPPNAKIGDQGFDSSNDGEFNAVATVEALPEVIQLKDNLQATGTVANISVICGDGPDHGRTYWVVNVIVDYKNGKDAVAKTYRYDIHTGRLTNATTQGSP